MNRPTQGRVPTALLQNSDKSPLRFFLDNWLALIYFFAFLVSPASAVLSQEPAPQNPPQITIHGIVLSTDGQPVSGAKVILKRESIVGSEEQITDDKGHFLFAAIKSKTYSLIAQKIDQISDSVTVPPASFATGLSVQLILKQIESSPKNPEAAKSSLGTMQFADQPDFTVAGVTDFTAAGGHGSDSVLRTSEALAVETSNLRPDGSSIGPSNRKGSSNDEAELREAVAKSPDSFDANHRLGEFYSQEGEYSKAVPVLQRAYRIDSGNRENEYDLALACKSIGDPAHSKKYVEELLTRQETADLYRLAAELDESLGNPLTAVREFQKAASLDPSEQNLFAWGSELLVHRAIWQAQQVFEQGAKQYPASSRMLTGLGTALFSGAAYQEAATKLCKASDLKPAESEPYIFLGKLQIAAPNQLECVEERLHRFVREQPNSAAAHYFYAMALQKQQDYLTNPDTRKRSDVLLRTAITNDPKYSEAYLQLGISYASQKKYVQAIDFYTKAIAANSQLSDAYYRRAIAYERTGQAAKAKEEFALHDAIAKQQAAETERQRQEVKQFLVVLPVDTVKPQAP